MENPNDLPSKNVECPSIRILRNSANAASANRNSLTPNYEYLRPTSAPPTEGFHAYSAQDGDNSRHPMGHGNQGVDAKHMPPPSSKTSTTSPAVLEDPRGRPEYAAFFYNYSRLDPRLPPPIYSPGQSSWRWWPNNADSTPGSALPSTTNISTGTPVVDGTVFPSSASYMMHHSSTRRRTSMDFGLSGVVPVKPSTPANSSATANVNENHDIPAEGTSPSRKKKGLVDMIQEDFPRTPSPIFGHNVVELSKSFSKEDLLDTSTLASSLGSLSSNGSLKGPKTTRLAKARAEFNSQEGGGQLADVDNISGLMGELSFGNPRDIYHNSRPHQSSMPSVQAASPQYVERNSQYDGFSHMRPLESHPVRPLMPLSYPYDYFDYTPTSADAGYPRSQFTSMQYPYDYHPSEEAFRRGVHPGGIDGKLSNRGPYKESHGAVSGKYPRKTNFDPRESGSQQSSEQSISNYGPGTETLNTARGSQGSLQGRYHPMSASALLERTSFKSPAKETSYMHYRDEAEMANRAHKSLTDLRPHGAEYRMLGFDPRSGSDLAEFPLDDEATPDKALQGSRVRSVLLEEFRGNKTRRFEVKDILDHIVEFSGDQYGSRFIQQKLEGTSSSANGSPPGAASSEDKALIFNEVLPHAVELMTDVFGNYVIQKFFELGTGAQRSSLVAKMLGHVVSLSLQMYGCRVVQKALEYVTPEEQAKLVRELDGHVLRCVKDQNGNHVIQKCIERVPWPELQFIVDAFQSQVYALATHPYGCRVMQRIFEHADPQRQVEPLMDELHRYVMPLVQDQYGNYVIQHILSHGLAKDKSRIIGCLKGHIASLSRHKFASNVVEKCVAYGDIPDLKDLVYEVTGEKRTMGGRGGASRADLAAPVPLEAAEGHSAGPLMPPLAPSPLLIMMKDPYANYVIQKMLDVVSGAFTDGAVNRSSAVLSELRDLLVGRIQPHLSALRKFTYGKHIIAKIERMMRDMALGAPPTNMTEDYDGTGIDGTGIDGGSGGNGGLSVRPAEYLQDPRLNDHGHSRSVQDGGRSYTERGHAKPGPGLYYDDGHDHLSSSSSYMIVPQDKLDGHHHAFSGSQRHSRSSYGHAFDDISHDFVAPRADAPLSPPPPHSMGISFGRNNGNGNGNGNGSGLGGASGNVSHAIGNNIGNGNASHSSAPPTR